MSTNTEQSTLYTIVLRILFTVVLIIVIGASTTTVFACAEMLLAGKSGMLALKAFGVMVLFMVVLYALVMEIPDENS